MNLGELANRLTTAAKEFYERRLATVFSEIKGKPINEASVKEFILSYLSQVELPADIKNVMNNKLEDYAKDALASIKRNNHMNDYVGGDTFDLVSAEAVLVDFINCACMPLDLAMYTSDLKKKK